MLLLKTNKREDTFNPGDLIVGTEESNIHYGITNNHNNFVGKVLEFEEDTILVKIVDVDSAYNWYIGHDFHVSSKHFTLLSKESERYDFISRLIEEMSL